MSQRQTLPSPGPVTPAHRGGRLAAVTSLATGGNSSCAVYENGDVACWGENIWGELGLGHTNHIGDNELPSTAGTVNLGGPATSAATGTSSTCAVMASRQIRCWGSASGGALGYGNTENVGDDEDPASVGDVPLY